MEKVSKKHIVVLTGAGISAESGIATFRDSGGLWEQYKVEEVATPEAWQKNPKKVLHFYNLRRQQLLKAKPNAAHLALAMLEEKYKVSIITQNIDDLHERAGSSFVLHLHGELLKARSSIEDTLIYDTQGKDIKWGDKCEKGSQLRPHVVWFGENVPMMQPAVAMTQSADQLWIVGTSLQVYPAASLVHAIRPDTETILVNPDPLLETTKTRHIQKNATEAIPQLVSELLPS